MQISKFPDCCTSLILSNIPYRLDQKVDPLIFGTGRTLYYLLDEHRARHHYCNIHAILTNRQIRDGNDEVLIDLGFKKVNISKKYPDGGERETGDLNTYVARWQDFRTKVQEKMDLDRTCNRIKRPYSSTEDPYTFAKVERTLPLFGPLYKSYISEGSSRKAYNTLAQILGFGQVEEHCTRYQLLVFSDLLRTDTLPKFWSDPAKGAAFYKFLSGLPDYRDYKNAINLLIDRYALALPKFHI